MEATILTLGSEPRRGGFPAEELEDICLNKTVHVMESQFFIQDGKPYWSVFIQFDRVVAVGDKRHRA
ncbi:MAG: hypothetical protein AAF804_10935 [Bacteroidota bacterium]